MPCRRRHAPDRSRALLRRLRRLHFSGPLLDDPQTIRTAAAGADPDPDALERWMAERDTEDALQEDLRLARDPTPVALALTSSPGRGLEVFVPELRDDGLPTLREASTEVLAWAGVPLASQEVAEVCSITRAEARERLQVAGAREERVGSDGFWTPAP